MPTFSSVCCDHSFGNTCFHEPYGYLAYLQVVFKEIECPFQEWSEGLGSGR